MLNRNRWFYDLKFFLILPFFLKALFSFEERTFEKAYEHYLETKDKVLILNQFLKGEEKTVLKEKINWLFEQKASLSLLKEIAQKLKNQGRYDFVYLTFFDERLHLKQVLFWKDLYWDLLKLQNENMVLIEDLFFFLSKPSLSEEMMVQLLYYFQILAKKSPFFLEKQIKQNSLVSENKKLSFLILNAFYAQHLQALSSNLLAFNFKKIESKREFLENLIVDFKPVFLEAFYFHAHYKTFLKFLNLWELNEGTAFLQMREKAALIVKDFSGINQTTILNERTFKFLFYSNQYKKITTHFKIYQSHPYYFISLLKTSKKKAMGIFDKRPLAIWLRAIFKEEVGVLEKFYLQTSPFHLTSQQIAFQNIFENLMVNKKKLFLFYKQILSHNKTIESFFYQHQKNTSSFLLDFVIISILKMRYEEGNREALIQFYLDNHQKIKSFFIQEQAKWYYSKASLKQEQAKEILFSNPKTPLRFEINQQKKQLF